MPKVIAPLPLKFVGVAEELVDELVPEPVPEELAAELPERVVPNALEELEVPEAPELGTNRVSGKMRTREAWKHIHCESRRSRRSGA